MEAAKFIFNVENSATFQGSHTDFLVPRPYSLSLSRRLRLERLRVTQTLYSMIRKIGACSARYSVLARGAAADVLVMKADEINSQVLKYGKIGATYPKFEERQKC